MKDKHNVILILTSSSKFNSLVRRFIKILDFFCSSFFSGAPSYFNYITTEIHLNRYKDSPCVFNFSFLLFDHSFVYRSSSWRLYMMVHQGFNSFSKCSSRFFVEELKHSSSCNLECNSFPYHRRWYYVILDNLSSCFLIHMLLRMSYFKSINLIIGVILGYISPEAFPKDCYFLWCLYMNQVLHLSSRGYSFSSPCSYQSNLLFFR